MEKTIKLDSGFECTIDDTCLDDMRLVDALAEMESNPLLISKVVTMIMGDEGKKALYKHLEADDGRVPVQSVTDAITELFEALGAEAKN